MPISEAHQASHFMKHVKRAIFWRTPNKYTRQIREYARHVNHAKHASTKARHLADSLSFKEIFKSVGWSSEQIFALFYENHIKENFSENVFRSV